MLSPYIHIQSLHISDHAHNPSSYHKPATPPQQLVENIQWYVQNGPDEEEELNGADERLVNQLIAELNTNPPDGETITLEVTDLAEDHSYCNPNHISCTHRIPCIHTHTSIDISIPVSVSVVASPTRRGETSGRCGRIWVTSVSLAS